MILSTIVWDDVDRMKNFLMKSSKMIQPQSSHCLRFSVLHPEQNLVWHCCDDSEYLEIENHTNIWLSRLFDTFGKLT